MLTLYERLPAEELPFYLNLMAHLARAGVEVPGAGSRSHRRAVQPAERQAGEPGRRASTARRSSTPAPRTAPPSAPRSRACTSRRASYRARLTNRRGPAWWRQAARAVRPFLDAGAERAARRRAQVPDRLRQGHAAEGRDPRRPLLRQRAVRRHDACPGIIDFGFAATDFLAYDLAIAVNDWCIVGRRATGALDARARRGAGRRLRRRAAADRRRARAVARAAARGGAALLAVAALRPASAAPGRARRTRTIRRQFERILRDRVAHGAARFPTRGRGRAAGARDERRDATTSRITRLPARAASRWLRDAYAHALARAPAVARCCCCSITSCSASSTSCRSSASSRRRC